MEAAVEVDAVSTELAADMRLFICCSSADALDQSLDAHVRRQSYIADLKSLVVTITANEPWISGIAQPASVLAWPKECVPCSRSFGQADSGGQTASVTAQMPHHRSQTWPSHWFAPGVAFSELVGA